MSHRWRNILLSLSVASILFAACNRKYSSDDPLPTSYSPSIIINSDNQVVYAFHPTTGKKNWELSMPSLSGLISTEFTPSPLLYKGSLYLTSINSDTIYKVNAKTGKLIKKLVTDPFHSFTVVASPIADGKMLYLATTNNFIYALDTADGKVIWEWDAGSPIISSPTIYDGKIYFGTTGGTVFALDKNTGPIIDPTSGAEVPVWAYTPISPYTSLPSAKFVSSACVHPPYLYIGSVSDSTMYCLYLNPTVETPPTYAGVERWRYKTNGGIYSSPTAKAGRVIFGSNDFHIYCLDTSIDSSRGRIVPTKIWSDSTRSQIYSSPFIANQIVYIGCHDYNLYAINIIDGKVKWTYKTNGLIKSSPLEYRGMVYVGSYDKNLYAIDSATGTLKWYQNTNGNIECSPVLDDLSGNSFNSGISGFVQ